MRKKGPSKPSPKWCLARVDSRLLRRLIVESGLQQQEVAKRAGISRYHLSAMISSESVCRVRSSTLRGLADAFGLPIGELMAEDEVISRVRESYRASPEAGLTEVERELLRIFRCLPLIKQAHALLKLQKYLPPEQRVLLDDEDDG